MSRTTQTLPYIRESEHDPRETDLREDDNDYSMDELTLVKAIREAVRQGNCFSVMPDTSHPKPGKAVVMGFEHGTLYFPEEAKTDREP